jgi:hypothetical protein
MRSEEFGLIGCTLSADLKYGHDIKRQTKIRRHPLNVLFDPFYPIIIVAVTFMALFWYFGMPISRIFDGMSSNGLSSDRLGLHGLNLNRMIFDGMHYFLRGWWS